MDRVRWAFRPLTSNSNHAVVTSQKSETDAPSGQSPTRIASQRCNSWAPCPSVKLPQQANNGVSRAAAAKIKGAVELDVIITAEGFSAEITVVRGLPCGLDERAVEAVKHWRFRPATDSNGKPVEVIQLVEAVFNLG